MEKYLIGTFDGKYHSIKNLKIGGQLSFSENEFGGIGFFTISDGIIKNLKLIMNSSVKISTINKFSSFGVLVGSVGWRNGSEVMEEGAIENCSVEGNMTIELDGYANNVGGLVGSLNGTIKNCFNAANFNIINNVNHSCRIAGVCGSLDKDAKMNNCYNIGNIELKILKLIDDRICVSGITGAIYDSTLISQKYVYNVGKIKVNCDIDDCKIVMDCCLSWEMNKYISNFTWFSLNNLLTSNKDFTEQNNTIIKNNSELLNQAGVTLLNTDNDTPVWVEDTNKINNGYPILKWQTENN